MNRITAVSPADVMFTQESVAKSFHDEAYSDLNETIKKIALRELAVERIRFIRVIVLKNRYYSIDNRRLYVFRVLNVLGLLPKIKVRQLEEYEGREVTTTNDGCHVYLRNKPGEFGRWINATTFRHCSCSVGRRKPFPEWRNLIPGQDVVQESFHRAYYNYSDYPSRTRTPASPSYSTQSNYNRPVTFHRETNYRPASPNQNNNDDTAGWILGLFVVILIILFFWVLLQNLVSEMNKPRGRY